MTAMEKAKQELLQGEYTCAVCKGEKLYTSVERGVKPLLTWLDSGEDLSAASAADKVVGKAAAFLYVLLGVKEVYAPIISERALSVLKEQGIAVEADAVVPAIRNRRGDGFCPMETAVWDMEDALEAKAAIEKKARELAGA